jgi:hypothetical protein
MHSLASQMIGEGALLKRRGAPHGADLKTQNVSLTAN